MRSASAASPSESTLPDAEHDELVAAEPGDGVAVADGAAEAVRDLDEHRVAAVVAEAVVDVLEAVEVAEQHRDAPLGAVGQPLQCPFEQHPVGQSGQRVVVGLEAEAFVLVAQEPLHLLAGGDVLEVRDHVVDAAVGAAHHRQPEAHPDMRPSARTSRRSTCV